MNLHRRGLLASGAALGLGAASLARPAIAQGAPLKIGMITTLSGAGGYIGQDIRDAFLLAIELSGGNLGGTNVQVMVEDDGFRPGQGKQVAERFMKNERIKLLTGIIFSNILGAVAPDVLDGGGIYVSPNASPSNLAGRECHKNFWSIAWQNDSLHESAGQLATNLGQKRMFILAPNYQAGRDALTGFKRLYKGQVVGEVYTRLDQTDYAAEMAQIRAANPEGVYQFHPGGLGIAFLRQYVQAGLLANVPMTLAAPSMDATTLAAVGDAAVGINLTSHWNTDFDNAPSKRFVAAFQQKFNRVPTYYAQQSFDTALAIGAALRGTGGKVDDTEAFYRAMKPANFESTRGKFSFGSNNHPIQDWYALKVENVGGKPALVTQGKVLSDHGDVYASQCRF
ncbi:branched-chain amino acid transport system substrate-binding protein [Roseomonas rosea]|uniref:Branched-chain amino acid transport system substrate-binding protein n=1 Tax=Muricoccus roseus TaxID=198092 RepID=A0A1M6FN20_9PROT|nr:ABC transporter substrate-binding protein [Roseomonas rosea]SHI99043.1 branched-chain amino acid transport system substrate-binding protein [Roseomonas rosea]